jgi:signal transduction histidine kinase
MRNEDKDLAVLADKSILLSNILSNILSNAIKFSYPGDKIEMEAKKENGKVKITMTDKGIGMPKNILDNLFHLNIPTTRTGTNNERGTGFGMPLVKSSVEFLGGKFYIDSRDKESFPANHGTECMIILDEFKD